MFKASWKVLPALVVVFALLLGAWTFAPASGPALAASGTPFAVGSGTPSVVTTGTPSAGAPVLTGWLGAVPGIQKAIDKTSQKPNVSSIRKGRNISKYDSMFIDDALATNTVELAMLQYAVDRVTNPDVKSVIQFMIQQHSDDQPTLQTLQRRLNNRSDADTSASKVFPGTPAYNLGIRVEDLNAKYLNRLQAAPSGASFDQVALDLLIQIHQEDVQSELAAVRLVRNSQTRNLAMSGANMTALHIKLMSAVEDKDFLGLPVDLDFTPDQSNQGGSPTAQPSVMPSGTVVP